MTDDVVADLGPARTDIFRIGALTHTFVPLLPPFRLAAFSPIRSLHAYHVHCIGVCYSYESGNDQLPRSMLTVEVSRHFRS